MKPFSRLLSILIFLFIHSYLGAQVWQPDLGNGKYQNPIIWADYSDPDICRVGDDFYMTSSSFHCVPALPILHSTDLVNWEIINHAVKHFPNSYFDVVQHGNGVWAPCMRYHDGWFVIYWGDPDRGIYMVRTKDPYGEWSTPVLVKKAFGNIDPSPLFDDDGKVYLVHAFANSRAGISHVLQVQELNEDGTQIIDNRDIVIDGLPENFTLEGPKFYKRNGYYYIFAPAGGVSAGWQMVYRSEQPFGPYEGKRVLEQGNTEVNGPHQGGWVELENGENWFVHFQELQPYGRIVHLQPVRWVDNWPVIGRDADGDGIGEPVSEHAKPGVKKRSKQIALQATDEFNLPEYSLAWQWQANWDESWYSLKERKGYLQLFARYHNSPASLWMTPNILAQKLPGKEFMATTKMDVGKLKENERSGLVLMGQDYAAFSVSPIEKGFWLSLSFCAQANQGYSEVARAGVSVPKGEIYLRVSMRRSGECKFSYSLDGLTYSQIGPSFFAKEGRWIGAKIGLFAVSNEETGLKGHADFDWFRVEKLPE